MGILISSSTNSPRQAAAKCVTMLDTARQMAELKFEAPLAKFEETDDWGTLESADVVDNLKNIINSSPVNNNINESIKSEVILDLPKNHENFGETFSGSLEDLVNTFDERITKCFCDYEENVETLAPVQVRTQEEIMNECQMWWTITGNFGNILPIDWSKSYARKKHMPALNLQEGEKNGSQEILDLTDEDEQVASDLDMHALILNGLHTDCEPVKTAEEVIREIDDIMQEDYTPDSEACEDSFERHKPTFHAPLYEEKLKQLNLAQLNEVYLELELLIREYSETLISELARRDELEYEKELKNTFISLLLAVQSRRRQEHLKARQQTTNGSRPPPPSKYLTTVIPYHMEMGTPDNHALQVLIKILKAINEDNPTVPTLLTDYILKVLCPT